MLGTMTAKKFGRHALRGALVATALCVTLGCSQDPPPKNAGSGPSGIEGVPVTLRVAQRSTNAIPGTRESLFLTIDDITRNQVMTTLVRGDKSPLVGPLSLSPHARTEFAFDDHTYVLELTELENALIGRDFAVFTISDRAMSESARIDALLEHVAILTEVRFVRSGKEYDCEEAVDHLRRKLAAAGDSNLTAEEFIDRIAARSSLTGDEYRIRLPDGTTLSAAEYFHRELKRIEGPAVAATR